MPGKEEISLTEFQIYKVRSRLDWLRIRLLYRRAFPSTERKPFRMITSMWKKGKTDVWCFRKGGRFAGFASTINSDALILIDYLAVPEKLRGQGVGSAALAMLCEAYPEKGLFVEIESPYEETANQAERWRRRRFYERCGFLPSRTMADVFGVKMELMCHGCSVDFSTYHDFYCTQYSAWAGEHILPADYPEA